MTVYAIAFNDGCTDGKYWQAVSVEFLPDKSWVKLRPFTSAIRECWPTNKRIST